MTTPEQLARILELDGKAIDAVARGLVRKWADESKVTRYLEPTDEDQLVSICQHAYSLGQEQAAREIIELRKELKVATDALEAVANIAWGYDGDCGATAICNKALAAMDGQK